MFKMQYLRYLRRYLKRLMYLGIKQHVPKGVRNSWEKLSWVLQFYAQQTPELKPRSLQPRTQFILTVLVLGYRVLQQYCYIHELHGLEVYCTPLLGLGVCSCLTFYYGRYGYRCMWAIFRTSFRLFKTIKNQYGFSSMMMAYGVFGMLLQLLRVLVALLLMVFFFVLTLNVLYLTAFGFSPTQELYKYCAGEQEWDEFWRRLRYPASYKRYVFGRGRPRLSTFEDLGEDPKCPGK